MTRSLFLTFLVLFASVAPLAAQVVFTPAVVKLGEIRGGPPLTVRVPFRNSGTHDVEIVGVLPGCSCLTTKLDRNQLRPGETGSAEISLRTLGHRDGPYVWTLKLRSREIGSIRPASAGVSTERETNLRIEAVVRNEITLEPSELSIFTTGDITKEVALNDLRSVPFKVTRVASTVTGVEPDCIEERPGRFRLRLCVNGKGDGTQDGRVEITTNDPDYPLITLPLKVVRSSVGKIQATPERIRLGGTRKTAMVRLRGNGTPLKVERVDAPGLKCTWAGHSSGEVFLKVAMDRMPAEATFVRVHFVGKAEVLEVPVEWE